MFHRRKLVIQFWNDMRVSKQYQIWIFWVTYFLPCSTSFHPILFHRWQNPCKQQNMSKRSERVLHSNHLKRLALFLPVALCLRLVRALLSFPGKRQLQRQEGQRGQQGSKNSFVSRVPGSPFQAFGECRRHLEASVEQMSLHASSWGHENITPLTCGRMYSWKGSAIGTWVKHAPPCRTTH